MISKHNLIDIINRQPSIINQSFSSLRNPLTNHHDLHHHHPKCDKSSWSSSSSSKAHESPTLSGQILLEVVHLFLEHGLHLLGLLQVIRQLQFFHLQLSDCGFKEVNLGLKVAKLMVCCYCKKSKTCWGTHSLTLGLGLPASLADGVLFATGIMFSREAILFLSSLFWLVRAFMASCQFINEHEERKVISNTITMTWLLN